MRAPDGGEAVAAHHDQVAMRLVGLTERVRGHWVQVGFGRGLADGLAEGGLPRGRWVAPLDAHRSGNAEVRGDKLEVRALVTELVDGRAVQVARHQQVSE